jgi:peptidoglycan/xylan/chitin deacetylase (PgdA/CDA1 family)
MVGSRGPARLDGVFEAMRMAGHLGDIRAGVAEIDALNESEAIPDRVEKARQVINRIRKLPDDEFMKTCAGINRYLSDNFDLDTIRWKYETMSWGDMREAQGHGVDFGYHSRTHPILTQVPAALLEEEIALPREEYGSEGISLRPLFCYPDGKCNDEVVSVLEDQGYAGAVTLQKGYNDPGANPFLLRRVNIHEGNGGSVPRFVVSIGIQNR